ncbi:MAG: hypothetical protein KDD63_16565, partial [Bacteroidetes bacterium]|nr:hypothetical protein [Bacteroidota bacterium]
RYSLEDQYIKTLSEAIPHFVTEAPLVWVHEFGIYPEDEAAVVRWSGESSIPVELLLENGIRSEAPVDLIFKVEKKKRYAFINGIPKFDIFAFTLVIIHPSDTLYHYKYQPDEN